jgi:hypothetical protein
MTFVRTQIAVAVAGVLLLAAGPAAADRGPQDPADYAYVATIDCGRGAVQVGTGDRLFAPFVNMETGRRYWPIAWNVRAGKHTVRARKPHARPRPRLRCHYDDGQARGTVTIRRPKDGRPRP